MATNEILFDIKDLKKLFPVRRSLLDVLKKRPRLYVHAVDGITFNIKRKEIFGLVGESGSGKTTTGKVLIRLYEPTGGEIWFKDNEDKVDLAKLSPKYLKPYRKKLQIIYQDPYGSLNPRMRIRDIIEEPLLYLEPELDSSGRLERVHKVMEQVRLTPIEEFINKFPHQLSGGQRQRVAIARAIVVNPDFVVADEPVSMLDVSVRAGILNLLLEMREKMGITFLYITHDLATAGYITDRIGVMYLGKLVEIGPTEKVLLEPYHPYTKALISAIPEPDPTLKRKRITIKGEIPSAVLIPTGCRFWPRCPYAKDICKEVEPELVEIETNHFVACHRVQEEGRLE
ncbi:MAG: ABC transporter ATP-binding protein [Candidatus Njordarchaeum guaymaensis]